MCSDHSQSTDGKVQSNEGKRAEYDSRHICYHSHSKDISNEVFREEMDVDCE